MKKVVLGVSAGQKPALEAKLREMQMRDQVEIIEVDDKFPMNDQLMIDKTSYRMDPLFEPIFVPRAKHCRKGHERPWKYHK